MLLAKSRPIVVISMTGGSHFARECLMAFIPWHLDAVSGSHPPHLLWSAFRTQPWTLRAFRDGPVVEVMLTTVVEVGMPAPSTAFEALADKAGERARDAA